MFSDTAESLCVHQGKQDWPLICWYGMDTDMVYYYGILSIYDMDLIYYVDKTKIFLQAHPDHSWKINIHGCDITGMCTPTLTFQYLAGSFALMIYNRGGEFRSWRAAALDFIHTAGLNSQIAFFCWNLLRCCSHCHLNATAISLMCEPYTALKWPEVELGGMTKNLYHGIFLNYTGFTVYDGIFFSHGWPGVNHIFYWLRKNCSRLTQNAIF